MLHYKGLNLHFRRGERGNPSTPRPKLPKIIKKESEMNNIEPIINGPIQQHLKELHIDTTGYTNWTENTCASLKTKQEDNFHMLFGMATEIGELMDIFKKNLAYETEIDWVNVKEEIGDIMYYLGSFCRINNINLDLVLATNVEKLETRYPEKFSQWKANNRDLERERDILESGHISE